MDIFMLSGIYKSDILKQLSLINEFLQKKEISRCIIILYKTTQENNLEYYLEEINKFIDDTIKASRVLKKLYIDYKQINSTIIDFLKRKNYSLTIDFLFDDISSCILGNECVKKENFLFSKTMLNIKTLKENNIDFEVNICLNKDLYDNTERFADWIIKHDLDVIISYKANHSTTNETIDYSQYVDFLIQLNRYLQKKQYFNYIYPNSELIKAEVRRCQKLEYLEDNIYLNKELKPSSKDKHSVADDKIFDEYSGSMCSLPIVTPLMKNEFRDILDYLYNEGLQELKTNIIKRQLRSKQKPLIRDNNYDVLLVYVSRFERNSNILNCPPLGLNLLSTYLKQYGYSVKIIEATQSDLLVRIKDEIESGKTNIIGFSCFCDNEILIRNAIKYLKNNYNVNIFVGGPQAVALGAEFLLETKCDVVMQGEGEEPLKELIEYYKFNTGDLADIKNIKYLDSRGEYYENEIRKPLTNLDALPFQDFSYLDTNYLKNNTQKYAVAYILTGRGCPYHCAFCYEGQHSKSVRYRSLDNVFEEINYVIDNYPLVRQLYIVDDTFTVDCNRVYEFCDRIQKLYKTHNFSWVCEAHVETLYKHPEMVFKMVQSGLRAMQIGIESGSSKVLKAYNKRTTADMICDVVKKCKEAKLERLEGNIIIGGALESKDTMEESINMCKRILQHGIGMVELSGVLFWPFVDTPMAKSPSKYGIEIIDDQIQKSVSVMRNAVVRTTDMDRNDIVNYLEYFNDVIFEEYKKLCLKMNKDEMSEFWIKGMGFDGQSNWGIALSQYPYIQTYMTICQGTNYTVNIDDGLDKIYTNRTFDILKYDNGNLVLGEQSFDDIEKNILENSTGRYTISELAALIGVDISKAIDICKKLENKCLIYFSNI